MLSSYVWSYFLYWNETHSPTNFKINKWKRIIFLKEKRLTHILFKIDLFYIKLIHEFFFADPHSEERSSNVYIPRDESFSEVKNATFSAKTLRSVLHAVVPSIQTAVYDTKLGFPYFTAIDKLYDEGVTLPQQEGLSFFRTLIPRIIKALRDTAENVLLFETPEMIDSRSFLAFIFSFLLVGTIRGLAKLLLHMLWVQGYNRMEMQLTQSLSNWEVIIKIDWLIALLIILM